MRVVRPPRPITRSATKRHISHRSRRFLAFFRRKPGIKMLCFGVKNVALRILVLYTRSARSIPGVLNQDTPEASRLHPVNIYVLTGLLVRTGNLTESS